MNILYLTNHLNAGGITSYVLTLSGGLKKKGHKVRVASSGGDSLGKFNREGVGFFGIPVKIKSEIDPRILISFFRLMPYVKRERFDIIHANTRVTQVLASLLRTYCGKPYVSTCHGFFKPKFSRSLFPCWGQKVIAISEQVKSHLVDDFKVDPRDVRVVNNGIDLARFQARISSSEAKKKLGLGSAPVVGIVARLSDVKGHVYLIDAMKKVISGIPRAQLLIVGEGKEQAKLKQQVFGLGIGANVFFCPTVDDTVDALSAMDVFVMPSVMEGLGLSLMEAMAMGIPVIGSDVGGIKSLIENGKTGILFEVGDVSGLSEAITGLLSDRQKALNLGRQASLFIADNFSQEQMIAGTQEVYKEVLKG